VVAVVTVLIRGSNRCVEFDFDKPIYTGFLQYGTVWLSDSRRIDTKGSNSNLKFY